MTRKAENILTEKLQANVKIWELFVSLQLKHEEMYV
jgi:hypothetical protein